MAKTLEEIRAIRRHIELQIADCVRKETARLKESTGLVVQGIEMEFAVHYSHGKPDASLLTSVKLDLGEI